MYVRYGIRDKSIHSPISFVYNEIKNEKFLAVELVKILHLAAWYLLVLHGLIKLSEGSNKRMHYDSQEKLIRDGQR